MAGTRCAKHTNRRWISAACQPAGPHLRLNHQRGVECTWRMLERVLQARFGKCTALWHFLDESTLSSFNDAANNDMTLC
jgi:hypothetical protein